MGEIVIGSDKSGYALKEQLKQYLDSEGIKYIEVGTTDVENPKPFFVTAPEAVNSILSGEAEKAILICGTGMGMAQVSGKFKGIRSACVESTYAARMCRAVNNSNVLCLGGWFIAPELGIEMCKEFMRTEHTEGLEEWRKGWLKNALEEVNALEDRIFG